MKNQLHYFFYLIVFITPLNSLVQDIIKLQNPSFEENPSIGYPYNSTIKSHKNEIEGWFDCGLLEFPNSTAPDIHGENTNYWDVNIIPSDGNTYLGLVIRADESWESVSQELDNFLIKGRCYNLSMDLCKSSTYKSPVKGNFRERVSFDNSVVLSIWGGKGYCDELELLYESEPVDNEEWYTYEISIRPSYNIKYITLQAYYIDDSEPYNGNILVDNISGLTLIECKN